MSEHTPGSWQIDWDHTHGKLPLTICTGSMSTGMDWQMIASVFTEEHARLIVAAPDLLRHLKQTLAAIEAVDECLGDMQGMRDAIAKAEGHD